MRVVVAYDISDDRVRTKVAGLLEGLLTRVQYSVFECNLNAADLGQMRDRIEEVVDRVEDSVRIYTLCAACEAKLEIIGTGTRTEDPEAYIF